ncbi:transcription initiation factor IIA subunit 1 isoform X2 [Aethina tumida]|nr:transcription initiation factor IIA subunit 1 isoform X2 [Aethina tumida]
MASSLCKSSVQKTYQDVIDDVISNIRDHFLEDGVDEHVLQELKQLWETKLKTSKAVEDTKEMEKAIQNQNKMKQDELAVQKGQQMLRQVVGQVAPNNHMAMLPTEYRRVPIQLTIPPMPGTDDGPRSLAIEVPEMFLRGNHLKDILTSSVISTTMGLPVINACNFLQDVVNQAFAKHQQMMAMAMPVMPPHLVNPAFVHSRHPGDYPQFDPATKMINQFDGLDDSSDDDIEVEEARVDDPDSDEGANRQEEDPLNSEDDVSDADEAEAVFETENVIVCQ